MAAILQPHLRPLVPPARTARPDLRLIQGGRSTARPAPAFPVRIMVASFLLVFLVAASSIAIGRGALGFLSPSVPAASTHAGSAPGTHIRVRTGDTIWSIARRIQPNGDVRPLVDRLVAANGSSMLQAGDRLLIPS